MSKLESTDWAKKVLTGKKTTPQDWTQFLKEAHKVGASMTPRTFKDYVDQKKKNSYQLLADSIRRKNPKRILDLACGDGHLIPYLKNVSDAKILGVDMSEGELELAKKKKFGKNVTFKCGMAEKISEEDESFDAVVCHMALMLMNPLEPVLNEIHRVLQPGGLLAAVVGGEPEPQRFFMKYKELFSGFMKEHYPAFAPVSVGDSRIASVHKVVEVFPESKFKDLEVEAQSLLIRVAPKTIWTHFQEPYVISILPDKLKKEFEKKLIALAEKSAEGGFIELDLPIRLITCRKK